MTINKKIRHKVLKRVRILDLFKKSYLVYIAMFALGLLGVLTNLEILAAFTVCPFFFAMITFIAQEIFIEEIELNKPLTKKQRKQIVFVLDIVQEKSYFEVQYLKPGTKVKELNLC